MMSTGFAPGKPAADLSARDLMWLNEHPKEAKAALDAYAKAENERTGILTAANNDRAAAKKALEDAEKQAKDRLIAADADAMKIINDAKAEAASIIDAANKTRAEADAMAAKAKELNATSIAVLSDHRARAAALDKREADVAKAEARTAAKEADLQRRIAIVDAAHAEARVPA